MVAYGFSPSFHAPVIARAKRQTIRLPRRRHARPGERIQLYAGLRTKACRKLIPDPMCIGTDEVRLDLRDLASADPDRSDWLRRVTLEVNGIPLGGAAAELYARQDGFPGTAAVTPYEHMLRWWMWTHGPVLFVGVAIRWEDRDDG